MVHLIPHNSAHASVAAAGLLSAVACAALALHLVHIVVIHARGRVQSTSRQRALRFVRSPDGGLFLSLLFADLLASVGLALSFNWILGTRADFPLLRAPAICTAQAILIQVGETGGALSTLAMSLHTAASILLRRKPSHTVVRTVLAVVWAVVAFLAIIGPLALTPPSDDPNYHPFYCGSNDAFCWISPFHERARLPLHLIWLLIAVFSTVLVYTAIYCKIRLRARPDRLGPTSISHGSSASRTPSTTSSSVNVDLAARRMLYFPIAYIVVAMPLVIDRLGKGWPWQYLAASGTVFALLGFVDVVLYSLTRQLVELPRTPWTLKHAIGMPALRKSESHDMPRTPDTPHSGMALLSPRAAPATPIADEPFSSPSDRIFTIPPLQPVATRSSTSLQHFGLAL